MWFFFVISTLKNLLNLYFIIFTYKRAIMYGLVNKAIKELVVSNHGDEKWSEICQLSDFVEEDFIGLQSYPDELTFTLIANASNVLNTHSEKLLEAFGEYWILYTANEGYSEMLNLAGNTFVSFLNNLDLLHYQVNNIMPNLAPPQFTTRNQQSNSIELEYRSHRIGMIPMLNGLLIGLGKRFNLEVHVTQIEFLAQGDACDVFSISW